MLNALEPRGFKNFLMGVNSDSISQIQVFFRSADKIIQSKTNGIYTLLLSTHSTIKCLCVA